MHVPGLDCAVVSSSAGTEAEPYILKLGTWWISLSVQIINMKLILWADFSQNVPQDELRTLNNEKLKKVGDWIHSAILLQCVQPSTLIETTCKTCNQMCKINCINY